MRNTNIDMKNRARVIRKTLALILSFAVVIGMSMSPATGWSVWANTNTESVTENGLEGQADETGSGEADAIDQSTDQNNEPESEDAAAETEEAVSDETNEADADEAADASPDNTAEDTSEAEGAEETSAAEEDAEDDLGALDSILVTAAAVDTGDFKVEGPDGAYAFDNGVLTITGDVTVSMKDGVPSTSQRIVIADDANVTLAGVNIEATGGPAIKINAGIKATLTLADGSANTVTGASNYAGVEVQFENNNKAELTIDGSGKLTATGGDKSAGIGGSYTNVLSSGTSISSYCGDIIINGGTIEANGTNGGAGIGSANNNGRNADGTTQSASYKMLSTVLASGGEEMDIGNITINGGTITAKGKSGGAGIGGGNHCDSGIITINDGTIKEASSNEGSGIGAGRGSSNKGAADGHKGHGLYYANVTINGGTIVKAEGGWLSAGIGGAYECDAIITINGGTIERATGGDGNSGSYYQGAPGIGAGYQGNVKFTMTGGTIEYAKGGTSAPGIGYGAGIFDYGDYRSDVAEHVSAEDSLIKITGGTIELAEGGMYAAGIGSGNGCGTCNIEITGGDIMAMGYSDPDDLTAGGAGIGSGAGLASGLKYSRNTNETISITGGNVIAIGGWGAAGIGSGASNTTATSITIDATKANIEAYADGTKFAIDTRDVQGDHTESITEGRTITGNILQGTFVHDYTSEDGVDQGTEGIKEIQIINDADDSDVVVLTGMATKEEGGYLEDGLKGYRSFATNVSSEGAYNVFTEIPQVAEGEPRYYNKCLDDTRTEDDVDTNKDVVERGVKYTVTGDFLSDNFYLFPVKAVIVTKTVEIDGSKDGLTGEVYFSLRRYTIDDHGEKIIGDFEKRDGKQWIESIHIEDGVAKDRAEFICVDEAFYDVMEVTEEGTPINVTTMDVRLGDAKLTKIETKHGDGSDNNAQISKDRWMDYVTVINYYEREGVKIRITKSITDYFDANDGAENNTANATFIFKVRAYGADTSEALYENYISVTFDEYGDPQSEELEIKGVSGIETIKVTEVYGAGYQADEAEQTISLNGDDAAEKTEDGFYEFEFTNTYGDKIVEGSGVLNRYQDKSYVDPDAA